MRKEIFADSELGDHSSPASLPIPVHEGASLMKLWSSFRGSFRDTYSSCVMVRELPKTVSKRTRKRVSSEKVRKGVAKRRHALNFFYGTFKLCV